MEKGLRGLACLVDDARQVRLTKSFGRKFHRGAVRELVSRTEFELASTTTLTEPTYAAMEKRFSSRRRRGLSAAMNGSFHSAPSPADRSGSGRSAETMARSDTPEKGVVFGTLATSRTVGTASKGDAHPVPVAPPSSSFGRRRTSGTRSISSSVRTPCQIMPCSPNA